jgi:hypothetical protein
MLLSGVFSATDSPILRPTMKATVKIIVGSFVVFAVALLASQILQAQGTMTYLSNLDQNSAGSLTAGSDSWLAAPFETGTNASGYMLNSVQLGMADASGNPRNFTVMLYSLVIGGGSPGSSLDILSGSLNPVTGGIFSYTPTLNLTLHPNTFYYIVLTAGTAVANGAYDWSYVGASSYNPSGGWGGFGGVLTSSDGSSWLGGYSVNPQYAVNATAIPEPGVLGLLGLGALVFLWHRRKVNAI